jgi:hypothetical protein
MAKKVIHHASDPFRLYPTCSAGYGKGRPPRGQRFSLYLDDVTCKTCLKIMNAKIAAAKARDSVGQVGPLVTPVSPVTKVRLTRDSAGNYTWRNWRIVRLQRDSGAYSGNWCVYDSNNPSAADSFWSLRCVRAALAKMVTP